MLASWLDCVFPSAFVSLGTKSRGTDKVACSACRPVPERANCSSTTDAAPGDLKRKDLLVDVTLGHVFGKHYREIPPPPPHPLLHSIPLFALYSLCIIPLIFGIF